MKKTKKKTTRSSTPMPLICDRCGKRLREDRHHLYSFEIWPVLPPCRMGKKVPPLPPGLIDATGGRIGPEPLQHVPGRLCNPCGVLVAKALVRLARRHHLTCTNDGRREVTGFGQEVLDRMCRAASGPRRRRRR